MHHASNPKANTFYRIYYLQLYVSQIKLLDPYAENSGAVMFTSADIGYTDGNDPAAKSKADGAWIYVRGADFGYGASAFTAEP